MLTLQSWMHSSLAQRRVVYSFALWLRCERLWLAHVSLRLHKLVFEAVRMRTLAGGLSMLFCHTFALHFILRILPILSE